jgi:predicted DNA binding protein
MMPNYEARLEIHHDCPYCILTERYSGLRINSWDNARTHVAVVTCHRADYLEQFEKELADLIPYATVSRQCCGLEVVIDNRDVEEGSVTTLLSTNNCWCAQPTVADGGWEKYRVYSWDKSNILEVVKKIRADGGIVKIESVHQVSLPNFTEEMLVPVESMLNGLTPRQAEILTLAIKTGYFDTPAKITADEMAKKAGLSRSTFMEHLRKAEGKLLLNVLPLLKMSVDEK